MKNNYWNQFIKFYIIEFIFIVTFGFLSEYSEDKYVGLSELIVGSFLLILAGFMIGLFKSNRHLKFKEKLPALFVMVSLHFIVNFSLNYFDIYGRGVPSTEELKRGVIVTLIYDAVVLVLSLPIVALSKNRIVTAANKELS